MKTRLQPVRASAPDRSGFTLLELLVAMAVLTLMLLMVNQLVSSAAVVMSASGRHLDADTQARLVFNRMMVDFSRMLKRTDVDYSSFKNASANPQAGNDQMAFYSEAHGYFSGATQPDEKTTFRGDVSLVAYLVANDPTTYAANGTSVPVLQRLGKGLGWEPSDASASAWNNVAYLPATLTTRWTDLFTTTSAGPADPDYRSIGDLVFRMEYTYLLKPTPTTTPPAPATLSITPYATGYTPAHTSVNGFKDVAAIVVTIAMLDNSSRLLVKDYTNLISASATTFPDAVNGATPASVWNANINSTTFATAANIPAAAAKSVHVYERYFYLNSPQ